ncbi:MAG: nuclear transport factor 2 family protein [bacterium]
MRPNAVSAVLARLDAAFAAGDLDAMTATMSESLQYVDHPTGTSYGRAGAMHGIEALRRAREPSWHQEPLATLGESLGITRRRVSASGATSSGRFDVGAYEREDLMLVEADEGCIQRLEAFAADNLGDAVARLYARYAELLPDGPPRARATATARAVGLMLTLSEPLDATAFTESAQIIDHRSVRYGALSGAAHIDRIGTAWHDVADDLRFRVDEVLVLSPDALLRCTTSFGHWRDGGGSFERSVCALSMFGADGRVMRHEIFEAYRAADALARLDALSAGRPRRDARRRLRPNAATAVMAHMEAAFAARELGAVDALLGESMENIDHPTEATYGREGQIESSRRMMRTPGLTFHLEALATLGNDLCLLRRCVTASGTGGGAFDVGAYEMEHVGILELDAVGRCRAFETFTADRLGDAVARLYTRYAERLPHGPERDHAAAVAQHMDAIFLGKFAANDPDRLAALLAPDLEGVDHRQLSTWSFHGAGAYLDHLRALRSVGDNIAFSQRDILALEPEAILSRVMHSGTDRLGGGVYERPFLSLFVYDADGQLARAEWFDADHEAEALARFDAITAASPPLSVRRRVTANAGSASLQRMQAAMVAHDLDAMRRMIADSFEEVSHPTGVSYGREAMLTSIERWLRLPAVTARHELLATLGSTLSLYRRSMGASAAGRSRFDVGEHEKEEVGVNEIEARGLAVRNEIFAADRLADAIALLYRRYAELQPEGPQRDRAAMTAQAVRYTLTDWVAPEPMRLFAPTYEDIDHRNVGYGTLLGAQAQRLVESMNELAVGVRYRIEDIFALEPHGFVRTTTTLGTWRDGGGAFERSVCMLSVFGDDGRSTRQETFDVDRVAEALARFDEVLAPPQTLTEPVRSNAASVAGLRLAAAGEVGAIEAICSASLQYVDHTTGSRSARDAALVSLRARKPSLRREALACLGESLCLLRGWTSADEVWEEQIDLIEVDGRGRVRGIESFAADHLGDAIARLYDRHAALLPGGPERTRMAALARSIAALVAPPDLPRYASALAPDVEFADHRTVGFASGRGADTLLRGFASLLELAENVTTRVDAILVLEPGAVLLRWMTAGTDRASGGAFESPFLLLWIFGADGRVARDETFDVDRVAEALARLDELSGAAPPGSPPRRVQPNAVIPLSPTDTPPGSRHRLRGTAATASLARFGTAIEARDIDALARLLTDDLAVVHHPTAATYGLRAFLTTWKSMFRAARMIDGREPLAGLGESLLLARHRMSLEGFTETHLASVGLVEVDEIVFWQVDEQGRCRHIEFFAPERLGNAVARLYERHAELLPDGPARRRAAATSRALAAVLAPSPELASWTAAFAADADMVDGRTLDFGSLRGVTTARAFNRALFDLEHFSVRADDVLASGADAILLRTTTLGTSRASGGDFERPMLQLWEFDAVGLIARITWFDPERDAEALAQFDAVIGISDAAPKAEVAAAFANAATRARGRLYAAWEARDWTRIDAAFAADARQIDHTRNGQLDLDRAQQIAALHYLSDFASSRFSAQTLATRGERLVLERVRLDFEGGDVGPSEITSLVVTEIDARGDLTLVVRYNDDDLHAAYAELDARWGAGEGAAHAAQVGLMAACSRAVASREWDPIIALCAPGFIEHDRRGLAVLGTTRGAKAWTQNFRALVDLAPDTVYRVDHIRSAARGLWSIGTWCGTRDGGSYEIPVTAVLELDERGRLARADIYEPHQLEQARARFAELSAPVASPQAFANTASATVEPVIASLVAHDWQRFEQLFAEDFHLSDRRHVVQLELDRGQYVAFTREVADGRTVRGESTLIATRGERLALTHSSFVFADTDVGPSEIAFLIIQEVDERRRIAAYVRFDPDDLAAAYAELDRRYAAGEAAPCQSAVAWMRDYSAALTRRDWAAVAACFAPGFVGDDHRLVGWGTLHGAAAFVEVLRAMVELAPDAHTRPDHVRASQRGAIAEIVWVGTRDGGAFESPFVYVLELDAQGRGLRLDLYDPHHVERARARLAEIEAGPAHDARQAFATPTTATVGMERSWALFDAGDWDACRAACGPGFRWEDRRPLFRLSGDIELMIASARERLASGARHQRRAIVGTAGDRVVITSVLWAGGPTGGRFEVEFLAMHECDEAGLGVATIFFDPDDARAAQREAWARWAAIDPAAAALTTALDAVLDAGNAHDLVRYRAVFADDLAVEDHRRSGGLRFAGADEYAEKVAALWQFAPDSRIDAGWFWPAFAPHGAVTVTKRLGGLADEFLWLYSVEDGRITRIEVFGLDDLDAAKARLAELCPDPLRIPPNAATRVIDRHLALAAAEDWDAVQALHAPGLVFDDRRKGLRTTVDGAAYLAGLQWAGHGIERQRTVLATAGDRLELRHNRFTRTEDVLLFEVETLAVTEIDAGGHLAAIVLFDPEARRAASIELFERYAANGADGASPQALDLVRAWNDHDLERVRALLADDFYLDDRRRTGVGRLDGADAYVASLAALWELSRDLRIEALYFDRIEPHRYLYVNRWSGTNDEGGEFDAVYVCLSLARGDLPAGLEIFELEDIDIARARFDELCGAHEQETP